MPYLEYSPSLAPRSPPRSLAPSLAHSLARALAHISLAPSLACSLARPSLARRPPGLEVQGGLGSGHALPAGALVGSAPQCSLNYAVNRISLPQAEMQLC